LGGASGRRFLLGSVSARPKNIKVLLSAVHVFESEPEEAGGENGGHLGASGRGAHQSGIR